jgi:hypothetical protein
LERMRVPGNERGHGELDVVDEPARVLDGVEGEEP